MGFQWLDDFTRKAHTPQPLETWEQRRNLQAGRFRSLSAPASPGLAVRTWMLSPTTLMPVTSSPQSPAAFISRAASERLNREKPRGLRRLGGFCEGVGGTIILIPFGGWRKRRSLDVNKPLIYLAFFKFITYFGQAETLWTFGASSCCDASNEPVPTLTSALKTTLEFAGKA
jgi:hypothetical protein